MPSTITYKLDRKPKDSDTPWAFHVQPTHDGPNGKDGQEDEPPWRFTAHDTGIFIDLPAANTFLTLRWHQLALLAAYLGEDWDAPCDYTLTPEAEAQLAAEEEQQL